MPTEKVGLQELAFDAEFDGVICVDAMENVPPEDWPLVLANLRRALRPGGYLYLTVELPDEEDLQRVSDAAAAAGLPVAPGEHVVPGGGYHYYPPLDQVAAWVREAGLEPIAEERDEVYYHLLARVAAGRRAGLERVTGIEPASRAWKARPAPSSWPDASPTAQVRRLWDRPLLTVTDRELPVLRARGGHGRREPTALQRGGDGHKLNRRVRLVLGDHCLVGKPAQTARQRATAMC